MQNTTIECPHCHSNLEAPVSFQGREVECPACKNSFVIEVKHEPYKPRAVNAVSRVSLSFINTLFENSKNVFIGVSLLGLLISIISLVVVLSTSGIPKLKLASDPSDAVKEIVAFNIEFKRIGMYFWRKNGDKILKSLEIKEIKTNGNWAVAFYKLSLGATEVKKAVFLYKSSDGYWLEAASYIAEKKCQTNWYKDMKNRIERFTKDSEDFDFLDI